MHFYLIETKNGTIQPEGYIKHNNGTHCLRPFLVPFSGQFLRVERLFKYLCTLSFPEGYEIVTLRPIYLNNRGYFLHNLKVQPFGYHH